MNQFNESAPISGKKLDRVFWLTLTVALVMVILSLAGVLLTDWVYPDPEQVETFLPNDVVNLIIGLPFFAVVLVLLKHGKLAGQLLLPGPLIYVLYNYLAYSLGPTWSIFTALNLGLCFLCAYTLFVLFSNIDQADIKSRLNGFVPRKSTGWVLALMGGAFSILAGYRIINAYLTGIPLSLGEQVTSLADGLVSFFWIGGGILLLRDRDLGYTLGLGLLMAASSLFIGLILFLILSPWIGGGSFDLAGVVTVLLMGLICFIPSASYLRGVFQADA